jgi:16S rRNA (cytosine967-C5)-methyltransferase
VTRTNSAPPTLGARPHAGPHVAAAWVEAAGRIYIAGIRARGALDEAVADAMRKLGPLPDDGRAFAVDTAQAMFRARRRLEAAASTLPFEPTRHALVCLFLVGARGFSADALPGDRRLMRAFSDAWHKTDGAPLAVRASVPDWLPEALRGRDTLALAMTETPPTSLRTNTLKGDREALLDALAQDGIDAHQGTLAPDAVVLDRRANVFRTRAFQDGLFEVQDEGSQVVSLLCEARPGMTVVDGCAGAGGKTLHLAAQMRGKGSLHALDVHVGRLAALKKRAARADAQNVRTGSATDSSLRAALAGKADVLLVDAPCSGTGVLRRNPDTSWRLSRDDVARMQDQQRAILEGYAALVAPQGRLVYATCSLLPEENEEQVERFLGAHPEFSLVDAGAVLARAGVAQPGRMLTLDPLHPAHPDGFFGAVLQRS